jgi:hypothetical protein
LVERIGTQSAGTLPRADANAVSTRRTGTFRPAKASNRVVGRGGHFPPLKCTPCQPGDDDVSAIYAAARPLLNVLADRGLLTLEEERGPS